MVLADDIESFWLSAPSLRSADPATAGSSQLDRAYSQECSTLSHAPSLGASISRHHTTSEGTLRKPFCQYAVGGPLLCGTLYVLHDHAPLMVDTPLMIPSPHCDTI